MIERILKTLHGSFREPWTESRRMLRHLYIFILPDNSLGKLLSKKSENVGSYADYRSKERKQSHS